MVSRDAFKRARRRVHDELESQTNALGKLVNWTMAMVLVASIAGTILESVPELGLQYGSTFRHVEVLCLVFFSIEYGVRIWIATEHVPFRQLRPLAARWAYLTSSQGIIDLMAIMPLWSAFFELADLRILVVLRILRVLKFARYSSGMNSLLEVLWTERRALGGCLMILVCATLISASAMHVLEGKVQPDRFGTIPDAMWWALVTLSTIGYGDVVPATAPGKLVAAITIVGGLIMVALPVGIVATAFSEVIHRRDFIVTWSMVARVPAFSHLTATDIAHVMGLLKAQQAEKGDIIVRRGELAHSLYFIADGEVEIELPDGHAVRLGSGQFFGEQALRKRTKRTATAKAVTRTRLLVLNALDWRGLIAREPSISDHVKTVAAMRMGHAHDDESAVLDACPGREKTRT